MCIIQDEKFDAEIETAGMEGICSNSYLTIAASVPNTVHDGILKHGRRSGDDLFGISGRRDSLPYHVHVRRVQHFYKRGSHFPNTYLSQTQENVQVDSPVWIYQEHILPAQVVEFTESEMIWSCQTERLCECMIGRPQGQTSVS